MLAWPHSPRCRYRRRRAARLPASLLGGGVEALHAADFAAAKKDGKSILVDILRRGARCAGRRTRS